MKAKVKSHGRCIDVTPDKNIPGVYIGHAGVTYNKEELVILDEIDWEQRIYEIAKQMLPVTAKFKNGNPYKVSIKHAAMSAYEYAYELCKVLKQENEQ